MSATSILPEINVTDLLSWTATDVRPLLLDVREPREYAESYIAGASNVPRALLEANPSAYIAEQGDEVVLYCQSGKRSAAAAAALTDAGYSNVVSLAGGIDAWRANSAPVVESEVFSAHERERYSRHLLLAEIGAAGQRALLDARVLIVGAGGLGSPAALYLAAAGVGVLGIVDDDVVEISNLQRQIIHDSASVGSAKTASAKAALQALNPGVEVVEHRLRLDSSNALAVLRDYDIILDGADNFPTRYLLSDAAVRLRLPVVSASILGFDAQLTVFASPGPCYRCLYPQPPPAALAPSCSENGVLGAMAGVIGAMQATEAVKLITGAGQPLIGRLLLYDALEPSFHILKIGRDLSCPVCSRSDLSAELEELPDYVAFCALPA
jgi:molybdopterin/thiamine biosynthesis adenylyltransferase/rhodanese-related sulfurtransferase